MRSAWLPFRPLSFRYVLSCRSCKSAAHGLRSSTDTPRTIPALACADSMHQPSSLFIAFSCYQHIAVCVLTVITARMRSWVERPGHVLISHCFPPNPNKLSPVHAPPRSYAVSVVGVDSPCDFSVDAFPHGCRSLITTTVLPAFPDREWHSPPLGIQTVRGAGDLPFVKNKGFNH